MKLRKPSNEFYFFFESFFSFSLTIKYFESERAPAKQINFNFSLSSNKPMNLADLQKMNKIMIRLWRPKNWAFLSGVIVCFVLTAPGPRTPGLEVGPSEYGEMVIHFNITDNEYSYQLWRYLQDPYTSKCQ